MLKFVRSWNTVVRDVEPMTSGFKSRKVVETARVPIRDLDTARQLAVSGCGSGPIQPAGGGLVAAGRDTVRTGPGCVSHGLAAALSREKTRAVVSQ
jgi:hypothetical protein